MKGCRKKRAPRWNGAIWAVKCDNVSAHPEKHAVRPWMRIVARIYYHVLRIALKPTMPSFRGRCSGVLVFGVAPSAGALRYVRCEARGPETRPRVRIRYDGGNEKGCPMPDIALRFDKDMLVVSAPVSAALARQGVDVDRDLELMTVLEPDSIQEAMRLESMAGAQCLVTSTAGITPARMAQVGMEDRACDVARASLEVLRPLKPQHVLVEIGPCGLPLDASSKASLNENRDQYARAARLFAGEQFDAFFLNGFTRRGDLLCALMGVRQVSSLSRIRVGRCACGRHAGEWARDPRRGLRDHGRVWRFGGGLFPGVWNRGCLRAREARRSCLRSAYSRAALRVRAQAETGRSHGCEPVLLSRRRRRRRGAPASFGRSVLARDRRCYARIYRSARCHDGGPRCRGVPHGWRACGRCIRCC